MGRLAHQVVIVTGGARGQGAAAARLCRDEGAVVYLADVLVDQGRAVAADLDATFVEHDVASAASWAALTDRVVTERGQVDALVNNAGIIDWSSMTETSLETWDRIVAVNQTGVFLGMRSVAPIMTARGSGVIVNTSSIAGMQAPTACFAYGATKWAIRGMTRAAARELGPHGVRVNSVHPGLIQTDMTSHLGESEEMTARIPMGRAGRPEDVARVIVFLLSDESDYVSGAELVVDGGWIA